jgi:hypothetical protein
MRYARLFLVALATMIVNDSGWLTAGSVPVDDRTRSYADRPMPRVRSSDSTIVALIARAYTLSATFSRVVDLISATNGIVYVEPGQCRRLRGCMALRITAAGPQRILFIVVDLRKAADCDLMASIGHELWHAWEVLSDASLTSDAAMYFFYERARTSRQPLDGVVSSSGAWETEGARRAGFDVLAELLNHRKATSDACEVKATGAVVSQETAGQE